MVFNSVEKLSNMEKARGKVAGTLDDLGGGSDKAKQMQRKRVLTVLILIGIKSTGL